MSTTPTEGSHPETDYSKCPRRADLIISLAMPDRLSNEVRAKIATHVPECVRCKDFLERVNAAREEGEKFVQSLPEDSELVKLATTTPDDDWRMLSAIIEKCADLLRVDISSQYAIEALTSLTHRKTLPLHLLARIEDICEAGQVTIG